MVDTLPYLESSSCVNLMLLKSDRFFSLGSDKCYYYSSYDFVWKRNWLDVISESLCLMYYPIFDLIFEPVGLKA